MTEPALTNSAAPATGAKIYRPEEVVIACHGDEVYGVGSVVKVYADYMPGALFLCMREGALAEYLRSRGKRVRVAGEGLSFVPAGTGRSILKMPAVLREARRAAKRIWPILQGENIRVFHSHWLSHYLIGSGLREYGIKNIWHVHNNTSRTRLFGLGIKLNHLLAWRHADAIIAVSEFIAGNWRGCGRPVRAVLNSALPVHEGVVDLPASPVRCIAAGRMDESKGLHLAAEAVIAARKAGVEAELDIFGGPVEGNAYAEKIQRRIDQTGSGGAIRLMGFADDLRRRHPSYHVALHCMQAAESCSMWICETQADGLPVVASATGGTPELVVDGQTGVLFAAGNLADLTAKFLALVRDPGKLSAMRGAAFERGRMGLNPQRQVSETLAAYGMRNED